jgi:molybdopterin-guanine dinucleotide biosynthesis protein A
VNDASNAVIAAAILAGGDSQRMGEDKAALGHEGASLIDRQVKDLRDLSQSLPILICSGSRRYEALNTYGVRHVPDSVTSAGPLAGVAKALETAATAGLEEGYMFVLPTDSLIAPSHIYDRLTGAESATSEVVLLKGERLHPLHGLFSVSLASSMNDYVESGGRSVMGFLDDLSWSAVTVPRAWEPCLNFNTPEEYERALAAFAKMTSV